MAFKIRNKKKNEATADASQAPPKGDKTSASSKRKRAAKEALGSGEAAVGSMIQDLRYGKSLSIEFFKQNAWLLLLIIVVILGLMGLRYKTKTKMEEIKKLKVELKRSESNMQHEKALYMTLIRDSELKHYVDQKGLNLAHPEQPPYVIYDDTK